MIKTMEKHLDHKKSLHRGLFWKKEMGKTLIFWVEIWLDESLLIVRLLKILLLIRQKPMILLLV